MKQRKPERVWVRLALGETGVRTSYNGWVHICRPCGIHFGPLQAQVEADGVLVDLPTVA